MNMDFKEITAESFTTVNHYANQRLMYIAERQFVNEFIWSGFYRTKYADTGKFLFFLIQVLGEDGALAPFCKVEEIPDAFMQIKQYFNEERKLPLKMYLVDETAANIIKELPGFDEEFELIEFRDGFDYIYDAEKLRTLSGRKMHKKKNHLNNFLKNYDGRYEYRHLCCENMEDVKTFHKNWLQTREITDKNNSIDKEEEGILRLMSNCGQIDYRCGGVYIDGKLEAYSIGSYAPEIECAFIHIEKANASINGLYNFINQQMLIHEFPDAKLVNREDDLGQEGLRKSKLSYSPLRLEPKYHIFQKKM